MIISSRTSAYASIALAVLLAMAASLSVRPSLAAKLEDRIVALFRRAVVAYTRDAATGNWSKSVVSRYEEKCGDDEIDNDEIGETTNSVLPPRGAWSDMASHDTNRGTYGSLYVSATGYASFDNDTIEEATRMDTL